MPKDADYGPLEQVSVFVEGTRVRISAAGFWADGAVGTVRARPQEVVNFFGEAEGCTRMVPGVRGPVTMVWVVLDKPQRDSDGDGPYAEAEIPAGYLRLV